MDNEMMVEALRLLTHWLYHETEPYYDYNRDCLHPGITSDDCKQYLATHEAQARSLMHAMIVIVDICKQFREEK